MEDVLINIGIVMFFTLFYGMLFLIVYLIKKG